MAETTANYLIDLIIWLIKYEVKLFNKLKNDLKSVKYKYNNNPIWVKGENMNLIQWLTANKAQRTKLDKTTEEILEALSQKKELEIEVKQIKLSLENQTKEHQMITKEEQHKYKLELQEKEATLVII